MTPSLTAPFTVIVDTREQMPFTFATLRSDVREGSKPLVVPTVRRALASGDYSVIGGEASIACERKSLCDLYSTLGQQRERFERELERLAALRDYAAVVIEAEWSKILSDPPPRSRLRPKTVYRSVIAWQIRYPRIHWWPCVDRGHAEVTTYRLLERWWREQQKGEPAA